METISEVIITPSLLVQFLQEGIAIEPVLIKDVGEITRLVFQNEQRLLHCTTHQFIRKLCQFLFLDFKSLQNRVKEKLQKIQLLPIPLTFQFVLFPLRTLDVNNIKFRGFLWVCGRRVDRVHASPYKRKQAEIHMSNGYKIIVPYTPSFVLQQMRDAWLVDFLFQEAHFSVPRTKEPRTPAETFSPEQLIFLAEAIRKYTAER